MLVVNATFLLIRAPVRMPLMRFGAGNSKSVKSPSAPGKVKGNYFCVDLVSSSILLPLW